MTEPSLRTDAPASSVARLVLSWGLVSVPLGWGVYQTLVKSMALFQ